MAKISELLEVAEPDGSETVVVLKGAAARRASLLTLAAAALRPAVDAAKAALDLVVAGAKDAINPLVASAQTARNEAAAAAAPVTAALANLLATETIGRPVGTPPAASGVLASNRTYVFGKPVDKGTRLRTLRIFIEGGPTTILVGAFTRSGNTFTPVAALTSVPVDVGPNSKALSIPVAAGQLIGISCSDARVSVTASAGNVESGGWYDGPQGGAAFSDSALNTTTRFEIGFDLEYQTVTTATQQALRDELTNVSTATAAIPAPLPVAIITTNSSVSLGYAASAESVSGQRVVAPRDPGTVLTDLFGASAGFAVFPTRTDSFQDAGATVPANDDGELVRRIIERSPNNHLIQAPSDAARSTFKQGGGLTFLRLDGVDDRFTLPAAAVPAGDVGTFVCRVSLRALSSFPTVLGDTNTASGFFAGFDSNGRPRGSIAGGTAGVKTATAVNAVALNTPVTLAYVLDGSTLTVFQDGVQVAQVSTLQAGGALGGFGAATTPLLGATGTLYRALDIHAAMFIARALTTTERQTVEALFTNGSPQIAPAIADLKVARAALIADAGGALPVPYSQTTAYMLGDSTVAAYDGGAAHTSLIGGVRQKVLVAVPGHNIAQQKAAFQAIALAPNVGWVSIQIGLNDIGQNRTTAQIIPDLQDLVNTVRARIGPSAPIILSQMTPADGRWPNIPTLINPTAAKQIWRDVQTAIAGQGSTPITGVQVRVTSHVALLAVNAAADNYALRSEYESPDDDEIHTNTPGRQVNVDAIRTTMDAEGYRV
jgi:hypothetical protein